MPMEVFLYERINRAPEGSTICLLGNMSKIWIDPLGRRIAASKKRLLLCVIGEWDHDDIFRLVMERIQPILELGVRIVPMREHPQFAAQKFHPEILDSVFLCDLGDYESNRTLLNDWWPLVRSGGVIGGAIITGARAAVQQKFGTTFTLNDCAWQHYKL